VKRKLKVLIAAGPTVEYIDPVRFISNRSTGVMGYALASEAKKRKHAVTLITGPVNIFPPRGANLVRIRTAGELKRALFREIKKSDCLIMASAVCDFRPARFSGKKISSGRTLTLRLVKTKDILKSLSKKYKKKKVLIGFSLETGDNLKKAREKMRDKSLDLIISNKITKDNDPFGAGCKEFFILERGRPYKKLKNTSKNAASRAILDSAERLCYTRKN